MTDITERLRSLYVQHGTDYVQEAADEIERLRAAFETESRLREHWGRQWEEQYAEIERLRDELSDATIKLENEKVGAEIIYQENDRLREALSELYAADIAPRDANHGRAWQNALRKAEAALRKPEDV